MLQPAQPPSQGNDEFSHSDTHENIVNDLYTFCENLGKDLTNLVYKCLNLVTGGRVSGDEGEFPHTPS